jgi:hypothetical protein
MLLDDARILDRHVPAGEIDHASAVSHVPIVERSAVRQDNLASNKSDDFMV